MITVPNIVFSYTEVPCVFQFHLMLASRIYFKDIIIIILCKDQTIEKKFARSSLILITFT